MCVDVAGVALFLASALMKAGRMEDAKARLAPLAQKGLDISLPQPPPPNQPKDTSPRNQVVLSLEEGAITINKNPVGLPELSQRLRDIFQARSDKTMFVKASGEVPYGRVVQAMDIARGAGVPRATGQARAPRLAKKAKLARTKYFGIVHARPPKRFRSRWWARS